jgi:hypothetical protein
MQETIEGSPQGIVFSYGREGEVQLSRVGKSSLLQLYITVDQKMAVSPALGCRKPTTNLQQKPDAEPKTVVSAKSLGR